MPKKEIYIVGCSGQAKVAFDIIEQLNDYDYIGFIDLDEGHFLGSNVLREDDFLNNYEDKNIFLAIGENFKRKKLYEKYLLKNHHFPNLIHPSATISKNVKFGFGNIVMANAVINTHCKIGNICVINTSSILEHDCKVSSFVSLAPSSVVCGGCNLGEGVYIGANSCVIQSKKIGDWSVVGASSTVIKDIKKNTLNIGTPTFEVKKINENYKVF